MDIWYLILIAPLICTLLKAFTDFLFSLEKSNHTHNLPPGPLSFPIFFNCLWHRKHILELEPILISLRKKFGSMITLKVPSPHIFIGDHALAHQALVQNGSIFAERPQPTIAEIIASSNQHNVSHSFYGPTWRLLRRNLNSAILRPARVRSYAHARKWVLHVLKDRFKSLSKSGDPIQTVEHFQFAIFSLLALICFGDKLDEKQIIAIEKVLRTMILNFGNFNVFNFWPSLTKIVFRKHWLRFLQLRKDQEDALIPVIRERRQIHEERVSKAKGNYEDDTDGHFVSYLDTMFDLELPDEKRKLTEEEMVTLCSEFMIGGSDTTSTAMQWIMANLVKYPNIQQNLLMEMKGVIKEGQEDVTEDDVEKLPYLKAIILEGLRRHPPGHFGLPHAVKEDTMLGNYIIPKNASVYFLLGEMGRDPNVWEDPMAFKPERFLNGEEVTFDVKGSQEIKMMPFGGGRRICPGYLLAMRHLEYYVANLVWTFEWKAVDGEDIDLTEKAEFTVIMKNPLKVHLIPLS